MTNIIIRFHTTQREAFRHGFLKGIGAPAMLFSDFDMEPSLRDIQPRKLEARKRGSIADDWREVGKDLRTALAQCE